MERERSLLLEGNTQASFKLSPSYLASDEVRPIILKVISNQKYREIVRKNEAGAFSEEDLEAQAMYEEVINLDEVVTAFVQSGAEARWKGEPVSDLFPFCYNIISIAKWMKRNVPRSSVRLSHFTKTNWKSGTSSDSTINMNMLKYTHSENYGFKYTNTR